ncbi:DUF5131 family protein [Paraburkholderia sp. J8-2]|uniref:DUF5131 family protein n=1 Tax=Paraburkholderia sp. J8-2 TaxID=2805440 RepID=UPI002AB5F328|nr:DUF5131 family protein [Paraburkholderia sp. J8-2]
MAENTTIEWCDHTWTLVVGCNPVSPACAKCYAALMAARLEAMGHDKYRGLATRAGNIGKWTGEVRFDESVLDLPLRTRKPGRWFLTSMGDIAHEKVTDTQIAAAFGVMAQAERHTFMVLTKRIERFASLLTGPILRNVFIGCTAENQAQADAHRPHMETLAARGWNTFVSYESALGPVNWAGWEFLQQLISGGESGNEARPSHPDWHRAARDFALKHKIAYLFKQWGAWGTAAFNASTGLPVFRQFPNYQSWVNKGSTWVRGGICLDTDGRELENGGDMARARDEGKFPVTIMHKVGKKAAGRLLDGVEHNGFPHAGACSP